MMKYEMQKIVKELNTLISPTRFNVYSMGDESYSIVSDDAVITNKEYAKITEIVERNGYVIEGVGTSLVFNLLTREAYESELKEDEEVEDELNDIFEVVETHKNELKDEFIKVVSEHPDAVAKFQKYYKYLFSFTTEINGTKWTFSVGGRVDSIYGLNVEPEISVKEILSGLDLEDVKR